MQGIVEFAHSRIVTVYGKCVLNQIVGAEADEVKVL